MSLEFWRNLSVVWISIHLFLLCLIPLGIAFLAVQGMRWVLGGAQSGLENLQNASSQGTRQNRRDGCTGDNRRYSGTKQGREVPGNAQTAVAAYGTCAPLLPGKVMAPSTNVFR